MLVVDADSTSRGVLVCALERAGHVVREHASGAEALATARAERPEAVIAEIDLPDLAPFELLRSLDAPNATRVLVASARSAEVDRVVAFELGVDDYVTKPFSVRELVLRVAAVLRRSDRESAFRIGPLVVDRAAARVSLDGRDVALTRRELAILLDLTDAAGGVRTRAELLRHALAADDMLTSERAVDSHVKRMRAKLGAAAAVVETVKGVGYRLAIERGEHER